MAEKSGYKVILLGDAGVGKTSIVNRRCYDKFDDTMAMTVGVSSLSTTVTVAGKTVDLKLWDTAGQEQYAALIPMFSRNSHVCVLVADADKRETVENLSKWEEILQASGTEPAIVVAINKIDLVPDVDSQMEKFAEVMSKYSKVVFVSAKSGSGIDILFRMVGDLALACGAPVNHKKAPMTGDTSSQGCC